MNIIYGKAETREPSDSICLLFGNGLIGMNVINYLSKAGLSACEHLPYSWDSGDQQQQFSAIRGRIKQLIQEKSPAEKEHTHLAIIWSAGRAGFSASEADAQQEIDSFQKVITLSELLLNEHHTTTSSFHMLSSAGGLFEGQTNVSSTSIPRPLRPYGFIKLEQELLLNKWITPATKFCYRPSSVYGLPHQGQRMGLIPTLLQNGIRKRVVRFCGDLNTVRDYVAVGNIGHFIAGKILKKSTQGGVFTLASAEPITLYQLKVSAEFCIRSKIYSQYSLNPDNSANNSFLNSVLPPDWRPIYVSTGLRWVYNNLLRNGGRLLH